MLQPSRTEVTAPHEQVPGVPSGGAFAWKIGLPIAVAALVGFLVWRASDHGPPPVAKARIELGETKDVAVRIDAGKRVRPRLFLPWYSYSGRNYLRLDARLLRDGAEVGRIACTGFRFKGDAGNGGGTYSSSDCESVVPPGGITALRVSTSLSDPRGSVTIDGMQVEVVVSE